MLYYQGYLWKTRGRVNCSYFKKQQLKNNVFLIKPLNSFDGCGIINANLIHFPNHMIGKRVRLKVEVVDDENTN